LLKVLALKKQWMILMNYQLNWESINKSRLLTNRLLMNLLKELLAID